MSESDATISWLACGGGGRKRKQRDLHTTVACSTRYTRVRAYVRKAHVYEPWYVRTYEQHSLVDLKLGAAPRFHHRAGLDLHSDNRIVRDPAASVA